MIRLKKQDEDLQGIRWVAKAREKRSGRPTAMQFLQHAKGAWCATDGHRLHLYKCVGVYEDGEYEVLSSKTNEILLAKPESDFEYPDWEAAFPNRGEYRQIDITVSNMYAASSKAYTLIVREMAEEYTINIDYFLEVVETGNDWESFEAFVYGKTEGVCFRGDDRWAIIMPMRI